MVLLSDGNTVNGQLEKRILEVRNYDDEKSGHHLELVIYQSYGNGNVALSHPGI